ncbi:MAG: hypothetical protein KatS3mg060_2316 [Dehalococcoidia bacterium]|nr:MAG: hypothetical protein KatS3mg060_2316 [Dehalococcoidia bacterium]
MGPMHGQEGPTGPMMGPPLEQLSGDAFDRTWMMQMVMHHSMAIMMARPVAANALHPELQDAANAMIADQSREDRAAARVAADLVRGQHAGHGWR